MLLSITTTHTPATDLGYLLHKNPARPQSFDLSFGTVHIVYAEATAERCTAAMLLDIDPIGLVRNRRGPAGEGRVLDQYVNDRPYVASSFLSVAIAQVYGSALNGNSKDRPDLAAQQIPLEATLAVLPARGGEPALRRLFEPLGYALTIQPHPLDSTVPDWGDSRYFTVTLSATKRLTDLLSHLYVLIPALDADKHYWIGMDEVDKLLRHGEGWLETHPCREEIVDRYLKRRKYLTRAANERLLEAEGDVLPEIEESAEASTTPLPDKINVHDERLGTVLAVLKASGAKRVIDLGCGEGKLLRLLLAEKQFEKILGMDVSYRAIEIAKDRLHFDSMPERQRQRIELIQGSLTYRDKRLDNHDAAALVEVIEHLDPDRLASMERVLFEFAKPATVVITTPNRDYNVKFETLPAGQMRHRDHRFEWSRAEFASWAHRIATQFRYTVAISPVGPADVDVGALTQMAIFHAVQSEPRASGSDPSTSNPQLSLPYGRGSEGSLAS